MSLVEFKGVYKRYRMGEITINAVDGISFSVEKGEFAVLVGASGAGKTTVLNILGGMDNCTEGEILVMNRDISRLSDRELIAYRRYDIGFVFQFYNLVHNLTAKENVELAAQICRDPMDSEQALESVGLLDRKDNFPAQLSGGEQQRVSIARALAKNPKLLLCDELTGALDTKSSRSVLRFIEKLHSQYGTTTLIITHNEAIANLADTVVRIRDGKIASVTENKKKLTADEIEL